MKLKNLIQLALLATVILFTAPSCVKEGPMGPAGTDGTDGTNGIDGANGSITCLACHKGTNMEQKSAEFVMSAHSVGAVAVDYAGGRAACAKCHSHEGFVQQATLGSVAGDITSPSAWECGTCHGLHKTFDATDYALRLNAPAKANFDNTKTIDVKGNSNMCVNCHQSRATEPNKATPGETFTITTIRFGPHYSTQGNVLAGMGLAEIPGSVAYPVAGSADHLTKASCTGCHMAPFTKEKAFTGTAMVGRGGHSYIPTLASCNSCHGGTAIANYNYGGVQDEVKAKLDELRNKLVALGIVAVDADGQYMPVLGTYPMLHAQAYFNWKAIKEDRSYGVHNPKYVKALLTNTLEAINK